MEAPERGLMDYDAASRYCGLPRRYFVHRHKYGTGPAYITLSPRRVMFNPDDLDRWIQTWTRHDCGCGEGPDNEAN